MSLWFLFEALYEFLLAGVFEPHLSFFFLYKKKQGFLCESFFLRVGYLLFLVKADLTLFPQ